MSSNKNAWGERIPQEKAVLCFIVREGKILLIEKKRGLGAGKINGPGGRIEAGESPLQAAVRETEEEVGVTPLEISLRGELFFEFLDGYSLHCCVFIAHDYRGDPHETDEATPFWTALDTIPYHEMWTDDAFWLPGLLAEGQFQGFFRFNSDIMLLQNMIWTGNPKNILLRKLFNINKLTNI
ncbi:MAG: 8-oxo-dGTP diphosphatase [Chthoniobacterales bacterium]